MRNRNEFSEDGYDICATPRCQVFGGKSAEHALSDRAIAETSGQMLLWRGRPADTLYSASCGGHTEDVEVVFPKKTDSYLRGVACWEAGSSTLRDVSSAVP